MEHHPVRRAGIDPHHAYVRGKGPRHAIVVDRNKLHGYLAAFINSRGNSGVGLTGSLAIDAERVTEHVIKRHHHNEDEGKHGNGNRHQF